MHTQSRSSSDSTPAPWFRNAFRGLLLMPVRWQGFAVVILYYLLLLIVLAVTLDQPFTTRKLVTNLVGTWALATAVLLAIVHRTSDLWHSQQEMSSAQAHTAADKQSRQAAHH